MRYVVSPTEVRELARLVMEMAKDAELEEGDRLRAMEWLLVHTKGRPGVSSPAIDYLELPSVVDAASALDALGRVLQAASTGRICADSAKLYAGLIGDAAKVALANKAVGLLANGGRPEFAFDADTPLAEQAGRLIEFLQAGSLPGAVAEASQAPDLPLAP